MGYNKVDKEVLEQMDELYKHVAPKMRASEVDNLRKVATIYKDNGDVKYLKEFVAIIRNYTDDDKFYEPKIKKLRR